MSLGWTILIAILIVVLIIGLFSLVNDPKEVDAEESEHVEKEIKAKSKRRWWQR